MSLLQTLQGQWDVLTGRFEAFLLEDPKDIAEAEAVLLRVRGGELHRVVGGDPWRSPAFGDKSPPTWCFAVRDNKTNAIVGVLQLAKTADLLDIPATVQSYALDRLTPAMQERTVGAIFFALLPAARKTAAGVVLLIEACRYGIPRGICAAIFIAEPPLLGRYARLGAWPIAPMKASPYGGYRIPLVLLLADKAHLEACASPLRLAIKPDDFGASNPSLSWRREFEQKHGRIATGVREYDFRDDNEEAPVHSLLTRGMEPDEIEATLRGSLSLTSAPGDLILHQGDGGVVLGVVAKGVVHVVIKDRVVAALGRGEPFGEIAFATGQPRTADLVAASPGTELLQLSPGALKSLSPGARATLWKNLAWCLGKRLTDTTAMLT
jgi:hypothetical protein